jgi:hypothetical protein
MARRIVTLLVRRESRRVAELQKLRAELEQRLDRLDFRSDSLGPALAEMARHVERTIQQSPVT